MIKKIIIWIKRKIVWFCDFSVLVMKDSPCLYDQAMIRQFKKISKKLSQRG